MLLKTGIKTKLSLFIALMIILASLMIVTIEFFFGNRDLDKIIAIHENQLNLFCTGVVDHHLKLIAQATANNFVQPLYSFDFSELKRLTTSFYDSQYFDYFYIVKPNGTIIFDASDSLERIGCVLDDSETREKLNRREVDLLVKRDMIDISAPVMLDDQFLGMIRFSYSTKDIEETKNRTHEHIRNLFSKTRVNFLSNTFLAMLLCIALAVGLGFWGINRMLRPISALQQAIKEIGQGHFDIALPTHRKDEIGALAVSFNEMATSLEKMQEEVKQAESQLIQSAKLASIGELSAGVAHEINQPLMVIRFKSQWLEKKMSLEPDVITQAQLIKDIASITKQTKRIMNIIEHLRNFSRQGDFALQPVNVNSIIEECFLMVGEQFRAHAIDVEKKLAKELPSVLGNPNQLEQVILNLLINARHAVEEKRDETASLVDLYSHITISSAAKEDVVEIQISDKGGGIKKEDIGRVFDPFFTTKTAGKGTGLGLSISYGIIKEHNGTLEIVKTGPDGTRFQITLPLQCD